MSRILQTNHRVGIGFGLLGGLTISLDVPVILLAKSDPWLMMMARGIGIALVFGLIFHLGHSQGRRWTGTPQNPFSNMAWVQVAILYGLNNILFTLAVYLTSTAKLVFIIAFSPMIAALLSWLFIGEKPKPVTWLAIFATTGGVALIVSDSLSTGTNWGDLCALGCATLLAMALVRARQSGVDMSLAPGFGGMVSAAFALPLAIYFSPLPAEPHWVFINVMLLVPLAAFCLAIAPKFIPAPQAAMFYILETVLAPVWVWMVFGDVPTDRTLLGGAIVLATLTAHSLWQMRKPPRQVALPA